MLNFFKPKIKEPALSENAKKSSPSLFTRLKEGLSKTRQSFTTGIASLFNSERKVDETLFQELESFLLRADFGMNTSQKILTRLKNKVKTSEANEKKELRELLERELIDILKPVEVPLKTQHHKPYIILMVGVNGAGKTTTIGKLAHLFKSQGQSVLLAAGDTFRAAAVEQLCVWGERNDIPVVSQKLGADSAAVIFEALQVAAYQQKDIVIADTAGRLHTQKNLMAELQKIVRVIKKFDSEAPHEIMLVLDAGIGQNAILQAQKFHEAVNVTGLTMSKLDGTAKGGILFAVADLLHLPIRFVGLGEGVEDLKPFQAQEFVEALFVKD